MSEIHVVYIQALSCTKFRLNTAQSRNIYFEFFKISGFYSHARATFIARSMHVQIMPTYRIDMGRAKNINIL